MFHPAELFNGFYFSSFLGIQRGEVDAFTDCSPFFGASPEFKVFYKVLVDQFVYCVIWSAPLTAIFMVKDADFEYRCRGTPRWCHG